MPIEYSEDELLALLRPVCGVWNEPGKEFKIQTISANCNAFFKDACQQCGAFFIWLNECVGGCLVRGDNFCSFSLSKLGALIGVVSVTAKINQNVSDKRRKEVFTFIELFCNSFRRRIENRSFGLVFCYSEKSNWVRVEINSENHPNFDELKEIFEQKKPPTLKTSDLEAVKELMTSSIGCELLLLEQRTNLLCATRAMLQ